MRSAAILAMWLAACAAPTKPAVTAPPTTPASAVHPRCAEAQPRIAQLYRAEAQARDPKRVDEAVADNTAMVMRHCAQTPDQVAACVATAANTEELEARCLPPLDDEGSEADVATR